MKTKLLLFLALAFTLPLANSGCATSAIATSAITPAEATTLRAVGATRDAGMKVAAQALKDGRITKAQWDKIAALHDGRLQPAYNLALKAAQSDLTSIASPDLLVLLGQFSALLVDAQPKLP